MTPINPLLLICGSAEVDGDTWLLVSLPGIILYLFMKVEVKKARAQTCDLMAKYLLSPFLQISVKHMDLLM